MKFPHRLQQLRCAATSPAEAGEEIMECGNSFLPPLQRGKSLRIAPAMLQGMGAR